MHTEYYLITDSHAEEVEAITGLRGHNTSLGVLVEKPTPMRDIWDMMFKINDALDQSPRCTCGRGKMAMWHKWDCPLNNIGS